MDWFIFFSHHMQANRHTIILMQTSQNRATRTFMDYDSISQAMDGMEYRLQLHLAYISWEMEIFYHKYPISRMHWGKLYRLCIKPFICEVEISLHTEKLWIFTCYKICLIGHTAENYMLVFFGTYKLYALVSSLPPPLSGVISQLFLLWFSVDAHYSDGLC